MQGQLYGRGNRAKTQPPPQELTKHKYLIPQNNFCVPDHFIIYLAEN